jgi:hypothetical protein
MSESSEPTPLPRCCPEHPDWETLLTHLTTDFTELASNDVLRELARARQAVRIVTLNAADALQVAELIARHQLMLAAGRIGDVARLDPEVHRRRDVSRAG